MNNSDAQKHVKGQSLFLEDFPVPAGTLYASVYYSDIAHAEILSLDISKALISEGVKSVFTYKDIPGENQIGGIIPDEELFAENEVHYCGQPIAIVVAESRFLANKAKKKIKIKYRPLPIVTDARDAFAKNMLICPSRVFELGDVENEWKNCDTIIVGKVESGGQEHFYLETQSALAMPSEDGGLKILSSTQSPTVVQKISARVLGLPMHKIEVDVLRLGGGFGGKEDQANSWASMVAIASYKLKKPVKLVLSRQEDMLMTGKRHPYSSDFKIGLKKDGSIYCYEVTFYQNAGASADLSPAILDRTMFHTANTYYIPNVKAVGHSCKTNLPPNTAFRGFGGPQAMFVLECAIYKASEVMGIEPCVIQRRNLLCENDEFPYGQKAKNCNAVKCWEELDRNLNITEKINEVNKFNESSTWTKRGIALMPICFGISFTTTFMNQASALVHVYTDGSVSVSTAAVEMGQGVNMKILHAVAKAFSILPERVKIESTNTTRIANTSPTAASSGADLNGKAALIACDIIIKRLKKFAAETLGKDDPEKITLNNCNVLYNGRETGITWDSLVSSAYFARLSLSSSAHYVTPDIFFPKGGNKGNPFAYHVYGTAIIDVIVDCLRGNYKIESINAV
ncbi:xanthine dehydrogenase, partial [bacterium]